MKSADAMLAVDTNVVVRYLVKDDAAQSTRAREIVASGSVFVSPTVILECEWVLRSVYGFARSQVVGALEAFCGTPGVSVGDAAAVERAFRLAERGLDFADALHLAQARECEAFITFDKQLAKRAGDLPGVAVRLARRFAR
jgi:predicted nucleic-acid-binding protein